MQGVSYPIVVRHGIVDRDRSVLLGPGLSDCTIRSTQQTQSFTVELFDKFGNACLDAPGDTVSVSLADTKKRAVQVTVARRGHVMEFEYAAGDVTEQYALAVCIAGVACPPYSIRFWLDAQESQRRLEEAQRLRIEALLHKAEEALASALEKGNALQFSDAMLLCKLARSKFLSAK